MSKQETWNGVEGTRCEHKSKGSRAWCFQCLEWCYPESPCTQCLNPDHRILALEAELTRLREYKALADWMRAENKRTSMDAWMPESNTTWNTRYDALKEQA